MRRHFHRRRAGGRHERHPTGPGTDRAEALPQTGLAPPCHAVAAAGRRSDRAGAGAPRLAAIRLVLLRDLRGGDHRPGGRADPRRRGRPVRCRCRRGAGALRAVRPGAGRQTRLQPDRRGSELGAVRFRQLHRLADLCRLHLFPGLRKDRPGTAHLAAAGVLAGRPHPVARLCGGAVRRGAGPVHPVQHGAQRRHRVPGDQANTGHLQLAAERSVVAADRRLPDVDRAGDDLRHQFDVPHRRGAEPAGAGTDPHHAASSGHLARLVLGLPAGRRHPAVCHPLAGLQALPAGAEGKPGSAGLGRARNCTSSGR